MTFDNERIQLLMLRTLGVLLIAIGFTMIARSSDAPSRPNASENRSFALQGEADHQRCDRTRIQIQRVEPRSRSVVLETLRVPKAPKAPSPPKAPRPPRPPSPPSAPSFSFIN